MHTQKRLVLSRVLSNFIAPPWADQNTGAVTKGLNVEGLHHRLHVVNDTHRLSGSCFGRLLVILNEFNNLRTDGAVGDQDFGWQFLVRLGRSIVYFKPSFNGFALLWLCACHKVKFTNKKNCKEIELEIQFRAKKHTKLT
jgi:hypothetical protein